MKKHFLYLAGVLSLVLVFAINFISCATGALLITDLPSEHKDKPISIKIGNATNTRVIPSSEVELSILASKSDPNYPVNETRDIEIILNGNRYILESVKFVDGVAKVRWNGILLGNLEGVWYQPSNSNFFYSFRGNEFEFCNGEQTGYSRLKGTFTSTIRNITFNPTHAINAMYSPLDLSNWELISEINSQNLSLLHICINPVVSYNFNADPKVTRTVSNNTDLSNPSKHTLNINGIQLDKY